MDDQNFSLLLLFGAFLSSFPTTSDLDAKEIKFHRKNIKFENYKAHKTYRSNSIMNCV
jgi:hypothetical protein